jgi:hypothetical protein
LPGCIDPGNSYSRNERREVNEDDYNTSGVLSEYLGRNARNDESPVLDFPEKSSPLQPIQ